MALRISKAVLILASLLYAGPLSAQEHEDSEEEHKHHRLAITISHTHVPKGVENDGSSGSLIIPSWGLNYEYWFNEHWAIGLHNDMEVSSYVIKSDRDTFLERKRPVILSLVGIYKFEKGLEIVTGLGYEFEENENFLVARLGLEYEFELSRHWDIAPGIIMDFKEDIYNSFSLGLSVGKKF